MYTRKDCLDQKCSHREYYAQFVTDEERARVARHFGKAKLLASTDPHLNDIPLRHWDALSPGPKAVSEKLLAAGDYSTLAGWVCIYKEAARQIIEEEG